MKKETAHSAPAKKREITEILALYHHNEGLILFYNVRYDFHMAKEKYVVDNGGLTIVEEA